MLLAHMFRYRFNFWQIQKANWTVAAEHNVKMRDTLYFVSHRLPVVMIRFIVSRESANHMLKVPFLLNYVVLTFHCFRIIRHGR